MDGLGRVQNIVVLGGTSEIGRATADVLLTGPGTIVLAGRDQDRLAAAATDLTQPHRGIACCFPIVAIGGSSCFGSCGTGTSWSGNHRHNWTIHRRHGRPTVSDAATDRS